MLRLRLSPRAQDDLDGIAAYVSARDPQAAQYVQVQLAAAFQLLVTHPQAGRSAGRGLRRYAVPRLPYLIVYRVDDVAVAVATVRHTSRRPVV